MTTNTYPAQPPARKDPRQVTNTLKGTFTYNQLSISSGVLMANSIPSGAWITNVQVNVGTTFNGAGNTLQIGTSSGGNNLVQTGDLTLGSTGTTVVGRGYGPQLALAGDTGVYVQINGTGATQGSLSVLIEFEGGNLS
jgi:hypothetical protein